MPYRVLPPRLRRLIPAADGQRLFRNVFNSQMTSGKSESVAFASAWAALQGAGYAKNEAGQWVKKGGTAEKVSTDTLRDKVEEHNAKYGDKGRVTVDTLRQVYDRGVGAYRTNPGSVRPNVSSPEQWAMARVNNFLRAIRNGRFRSGKHDTDLLPEKHPMSTKALEKADYRGQKVELDKPFRLPSGSSKKFGVYVRAGDKVKRVTFGDPNMEIRRDDPDARANFRSRHSCDTATDKTSARYWSCRMWESGTSVSEMTSKRQVADDAFTFPDEARARSIDLGLDGAIHVAQIDGNAVYMPGATHEDYLKAYESVAGIDTAATETSQAKTDLLATAITAIIGTVMTLKTIHIAEDARILKLDDEQRIVWGWASVSTKGGELVVDRQGDVIEPAEMVKMANDFMLESRTGKSMHVGKRVGEFIHSLPLTTELAKALGIETDREGWIVGMKVYDDAVWGDVKSGKYAGFSIGGRVREKEEIE